MSYSVSTRDLGKIVLKSGDTDIVSEVLQNVAIILSTWQQTVPLYRGFGLSRRSIDKPIPIAKPLLVADVQEAVSEFEPRANVLSVTFEVDKSVPGKLIPTVEVEINDE